jgi:hypothetical protein
VNSAESKRFSGGHGIPTRAGVSTIAVRLIPGGRNRILSVSFRARESMNVPTTAVRKHCRNYGPRIVANRYLIRFREPPASRIFNQLPVDRVLSRRKRGFESLRGRQLSQSFATRRSRVTSISYATEAPYKSLKQTPAAFCDFFASAKAAHEFLGTFAVLRRRQMDFRFRREVLEFCPVTPFFGSFGKWIGGLRNRR